MAFNNEKNPYIYSAIKGPDTKNMKEFNWEKTNGIMFNITIYENKK